MLAAARCRRARTWRDSLQHLTFVEAKWFEEVAAGRKPTRGRRSMDVDHSVSLRDLRADYRAACDTSNEIIATLGDAVRSGARQGEVAAISEP